MKKVKKEYDIAFNAQGTITQTIQITDKKYNIDKIISGLNKGKLMTTISGNRSWIETTKNWKKVAEIVETDNQLEYLDFEDETWGDDAA